MLRCWPLHLLLLLLLIATPVYSSSSILHTALVTAAAAAAAFSRSMTTTTASSSSSTNNGAAHQHATWSGDVVVAPRLLPIVVNSRPCFDDDCNINSRRMKLKDDDSTQEEKRSRQHDHHHHHQPPPLLLLPPPSDAFWDEAVEGLLENNRTTGGGYSIVTLPLDVWESVVEPAFAVTRQALQRIDNDKSSSRSSSKDDDEVICCCETISPLANSAHVTGYHDDNNNEQHDDDHNKKKKNNNGLSRYNAFRRGFVFSDGQELEVQGLPAFFSTTRRLRDLLQEIVDGMLAALERHLQLQQGWHDLHPQTRHNQWHLKEYTHTYARHQQERRLATTAQQQPGDNNHHHEEEELVILPSHTDPSLLSVVLHDHGNSGHDDFASSTTNDHAPTTSTISPGAQGLQVAMTTQRNDHHDKKKKKSSSTSAGGGWKDVHVQRGQAVVFGGSVLGLVTQQYLRPCRHRVVVAAASTTHPTRRSRRRMAATLFGRPAPSALLRPLESPRIICVPPNNNNKKPPLTFEAWSNRVARNYQKSSSNKTNKQPQKKET